jgi:hypothetical protein
MSYSTLNYELEHSETKQRYWTHNHRPVYNIMASLASESPSEHNGWGARASPAETLVCDDVFSFKEKVVCHQAS